MIAAGALAACSGGGEFKRSEPGTGGAGSVEAGAVGGTGALPGTGGSVGGSTGGITGTGGTIVATGGTAGATLRDASVDGSKAGETGGGRDGGVDASPPVECKGNDDCRALACDSTPRCDDGVCVLGTCNVPDAGPCAAQCMRSGNAASCVVVGRDADGDGHRDAKCADNPGDDCDDTLAAVHAGAAEVCDGLDNDCNKTADFLDGLPLGGTPTEIKTIARPNSARLGLLARASGYLLLTAEAELSYGGGNPSQVRYLSATGAVTSTQDVTSKVNVTDPAMGLTSNGALIFGLDGLNVQVVDILETGSPGSVALVSPLVKSSYVRGRSAVAGAGTSIAGVWAEDQTTSELGGVAGAIFDALGTPGTLRSLAKVTNVNAHAGRPNIVSRGNAGYAVAWVETQVSASAPVTLDQVIHLTLTDTALQTTADYKLDIFREAPIFLESIRGEVARPQVVIDADGALVVGYLRPNDDMAFTRVNAQGTKLCGPTPVSGFASWGAAYSMAVTPLGVLFAATDAKGSTDVYRVSQTCAVERLGWLNARDTTVVTNRNADVTLGDAAIARGTDGRLGVTWVERAKTANDSVPSRVMFRTLGPKLCD